MVSQGKINKDRLILSIIALILLIVGFYVFYNHSFGEAYIQLDMLTILTIYSGILIFLIRRGLNDLRTVDIYNDRIQVKHLFLFRRTIHFSDIINYNTFIVEKNQFLEIQTSKNVIIINRILLSNGRELLNKFGEFSHKRNQHRNIEKYKKRKTRQNILLGSCGLLLVLLATSYFFCQEDPINKKDLVTIKDNLNGHFEIQKPKFRNPGAYILFKTKRYPEYTFRISSSGYYSSDLSKLESYTSQDTIEVLIRKADQDIKLLFLDKPSFYEKHFNWNKISVYEVRVNNEPVFTLEAYNKRSQSETSPIPAIVIGLIGIEMIRRAKKGLQVS